MQPKYLYCFFHVSEHIIDHLDNKKSQKIQVVGNQTISFSYFIWWLPLVEILVIIENHFKFELTTECFINLWCSCKPKHTTPHTCWPAAAMGPAPTRPHQSHPGWQRQCWVYHSYSSILCFHAISWDPHQNSV